MAGDAGGPRDAGRLEAFSDAVLAIASTLLILEVRVDQAPGESLAAALHHALPRILAYAASFLQIGIIWANHALFRVVDRVDQKLVAVARLPRRCPGLRTPAAWVVGQLATPPPGDCEGCAHNPRRF